MKLRLFCLGLLLALGTAGLAAWEWPIASLSLLQDFASDYQGGFLTGVTINSDDPVVHAIHDGELVLVADNQRPARGHFPLATGTTVILQHPRGLRSVYTGLTSLTITDPGKIKGGDTLGRLALLPYGKPIPLFFRLLDSTWQGAINPLVVLPRVADERIPVIASAQAEIAEGGPRLILSDRMEMLAPSFRLFVQVHDSVGTRPGPNAKGYASAASLPQDIRVIWNGVLVYSSSKLAIRADSRLPGRTRLVSNQAGDFASLYMADGFTAMGELTLVDGMNRLEIRASDLDGNRTSASYRIIHPARAVTP